MSVPHCIISTGSTMRRLYLAVFAVATVIVISSCASAQRTHAVQETACADPLYLQLKTVHPDSLSEREYGRLHDLELACQAEKQAATREQHRGGMMGVSHWYSIPMLVIAAAGMALMMGRWW